MPRSGKSGSSGGGGSANRTSSGGPSRSSGGSNNKSSNSSTNRGGPGNVGSSKSSTGGPSRGVDRGKSTPTANRTSSGGPSRGVDRGKSTPVANRTSSGGPSRGVDRGKSAPATRVVSTPAGKRTVAANSSTARAADRGNYDRMNIKNIEFTSGTSTPAKAKPASATANSRKTNPPLSMGPQVAPPKFKGFSLKSLTSKDPANVARNRAAAAMYASKASDPNKRSDSAEANGRRQALQSMMGEMDKIDPGRSKGAGAGAGAGADPAKTAAAAPTAARKYVAAPAGYRPGIDPEHKFFTMKNGGKVKGKKK